MERHKFDALFRDFAEAAELQTPLRLLLLAWVESNWRQVSGLDQRQVNQFLAIAKSNLVSDRVTKEVMIDRSRSRRADIPLVVVQRAYVHIQDALNHVAETFERLVAPLNLDEGDKGPYSGVR